MKIMRNTFEKEIDEFKEEIDEREKKVVSQNSYLERLIETATNYIYPIDVDELLESTSDTINEIKKIKQKV
jgi:uncharacterized protein YaaN involved in tellurite resistance